MVNVFLAIVIDAYKVANDKAKNTESLMKEIGYASTYLRRYMTIMASHQTFPTTKSVYL